MKQKLDGGEKKKKKKLFIIDDAGMFSLYIIYSSSEKLLLVAIAADVSSRAPRSFGFYSCLFGKPLNGSKYQSEPEEHIVFRFLAPQLLMLLPNTPPCWGTRFLSVFQKRFKMFAVRHQRRADEMCHRAKRGTQDKALVVHGILKTGNAGWCVLPRLERRLLRSVSASPE